MAPIHCFHCLEEGHLKPKCPYLRNGHQPNPANETPAGQVSNQVRTAPPHTQERTTAAPPVVHGEADALEKRFKQQMENMERRMMDAMRKMLTPTNNTQNSNRHNQAKAFRTPDEKQETEGTQGEPDGSAPEVGFEMQGSDASN